VDYDVDEGPVSSQESCPLSVRDSRVKTNRVLGVRNERLAFSYA
jgi:hypothetical protein